MAERPLYTLYKNLKAQNYDVPDDYNKFESALTRDGKGGADNRHAIYENLKAQNFDVPSTYERFYSALFEPRSKTSSRAKGGSVPMSAADRARFLAGAQSVQNTARQVKRASGNIRKTVERAKKFNANDGKVTIGFKNPLQNQNVQKNEFNYNDTTGKTGTYTATDGVEFDNEYDAAQYQNKLDKYGEEWSNAVDMGIVPSELDKADPDLSDTDVAMRQMERRQEWLNENQNRRSKELNESMHLQGSPFVASGGAVAPSSFNTAISNEANRLSDVEYGAYNTAKAYNQMLRTTLLQELKEQKQRNENAGWWKDKWNDVSNYFGAMFNTMLDPKLYSQGVMDAAISNNLIQVKKGMEDRTIKKGSNAGNAAQAMLGAIQQQQGEAAKQQQYGTKAYQYGDMNGRSLKFMADFASSGWRNVMTTGFTKAGEKVGEKMALGALGKWFTKNTGRVLGDIAGSAALAATNQLGSTYNNVIERYVGMNNENGGVTQDKNGDLKFNEGVSLGKAIKDGFGSATIENFSEMFGEYLPGAPKLLSKLGLSKVSSFFEKIGNNAYYKWLSNATNKSGIQGVMAEISEEEFGTALHAAWGDGDGSWSDFNVFTNPDAREKQIDTCLGMFYSVGFMQAPRTAVGAINAVQYFNIKHQVAKADKFGQMMFNDKWDEIKSKIDVTTNADLTKTVLDATRSDSMTAKQKDAVINYAMFLSKLRGFNQAADAKTKDKVEEGDTAPTLSNDLDDAYTEGHNADDSDKHNIQLEQNDKANELAAMLHITPEQLHDMADEDLETMTGQDDKLNQAIYDYQVSTAKYQGVMDGAQDEVDMAAHQAAMETDNMTDLSRGTVRKATIKATGGLEDYEVYIISGNIATHDDGSIDVGNSDDMIIYYDPTTGRKEHADAMMFADLIEELPAADVKAQAINDAKENTIKKIAGIIDGTVEVGSQFSVTDADGTEHTYEVLADNGDGTAMITIDGNIPTELVKGENVQIPYSFADLQQMKDMEDQKRLETAKAQREQIEKERAAQQNQQTQPSFDFNQILNDNGNVVLADVLGKDGNTKYPNSQLFLIRDSGAKAKVVELKSDGTLVPHAVNKKDVRTATTMTLDEYKQAFADSSMIEENSGSIEVEDNEEGKLLNRNDDGAQTEQNQPSASVTTSQEDAAGSSESKDTNISANGNKNNESLTFEDGTPIPVDVNGEVDLSQTDATNAAEWYDNNLGEDADDWLDGEIKKAKKVLEQAKNKKLAGTKPSELVASKKEKEAAIADAQAHYDSAISIRDSLKERRIAKVEDTAEGRKELIEKARRKFARLKSAVKDDAEAVSQLYRETIGSLLHRLYDSTGIDVTDTTPLTAEEYVASNLGAHSLNYEGTETSKGVKQETGLSREDFAKTQLLAADGKGTTIDALVHSLWENRPSNLESLDTQEIRNALIGVLNSGFKASEARNFVENIRIAQAENILEEQKRAQEDAAYAEQQKAESEAELKAKSDEKAELKAKSEAKLDNESDNESNDLSNESDNEKTNDKINDNINVPEDATDENPLGAERDESDLPFSAKENGKQQTTAERAADVEKNKVDDMKVVDNIVGQKTRKTLEKLAKVMGANVQWQYSDKNANGWFDDKTNTIYLTLDSSITEGVQFIFGHEMTHEMRTKNPAAYDELKTLVKDMMGEDAFNSETDRITSLYNENNVFYNGGRTAYEEEVVADQLGKWIRDANYAHTLLLKMSHPLLAKLHEIVNRFLMALHGIEISDDMNLILRSIEQAYVKTANGQVTNSETGEDVSFSLRQKPEPKKKGVGYKVFVLKDGKLYPPMVANPDGAATPVGVWLDADAAPIAGESKTGRPQVKQGGKGTQGGSGKLAYRPGWHLGVVPYAIQFNRKDADGNKTLFPKNFVFAEVEYAADVDYQEEARQEGINPSGKYQHSLAGLKHLPTDGYYMYRTNPNPETDPWVITGAMKVNRILTRAEQADLVSKAGREPQQIQEGDIVTDDVVNSINQEIADAPKFSLKVYHGSGADFTEFDFDHMGEGAGSQAFGWGGYVTSSKKIGKSYATLMDNDPSKAYYRIQRSNGTRFAKKYPTLESFLHGDKQIAMNDKFTEQEKIDFYNEMKKLAEPYHNLYEVDIPEDNGSNYLDWEKKPSDEVSTKIIEGLYGLGAKTLDDMASKDIVFRTLLYDYIKNADKEQMIPLLVKTHALTKGTTYDNGNVEDDIRFVYNRLSRWMGSQKAASQFLSSLGFTGIKYPAGTIMGGAEEGDTNYVIFKPEDMKITEHTKFSLKTYHGTGANFDRFDTSHAYEGAGSETFGHGIYVTKSAKIGASYALNAKVKKIKTPKAFKAIKNGDNWFGRFIDNAVRSSFAKAKKETFNRMDELIKEDENIVNDETKPEWKKNAAQKELADFDKLKSLFEGLTEEDIPSLKRAKANRYEVEIPDDTGNNYLDWNKPMKKEQKKIVREGLEKLGVDVDRLVRNGYSLDKNFGDVYNGLLYYALDGTKFEERDSFVASSNFLSSLGFTGIKYYAGTIWGGAKKGDLNYVIFNEDDAKIVGNTKFSLKSKPVRFEAGKKLSDEEKKEVLSTLKDAYKVNGVPYHIEETAGGKEKRVYEPTADSYVVSDITNRPLRYYITLPDGRVAHPTEVYPNISDNEVKSSATKQGLLDDDADTIISAAIGNMKDIADNAKAVEVLTELQNLPHETHDVGYGLNNAQSYNYKTGIFTSDATQAIDYVVRRMRRKEDVPAEVPAALKKAVADSYGMVDNLIDGMSNTKGVAAEIKPVGVGAFGNIYNQFRGKAKAAIEFLKKVRGGEAVGALHHKDIGDIDLVWGKEGTGHSDGYGLSKLVKYHPEVLDNLQEILNDMRVVSSSKNRVNLESETHKAGVRLTWDGERKSWLLTAFKKETSASDKRTDTAATSLEGDTALSQTEGSAAKIDNSSETTKENGEKFSLKDEKTLAGVHNISEEKLFKAIKQGGLANPSVAVIDSSRQDHKAYGGISLIMPSDKIAKRTGKNAGTWQGDAYTPTYPQVERHMSNKGAEKASKDVSSVPSDMYSEVRRGLDRWLDGGEANSAMAYMFLYEKGVAPEPKMIQPKFSDEAYNELKSITDGNFNIYGIGKADAKKVLDMYIEAKFDGDKDLYEEKTKAWLERNKSIVDAGAKGGMRYAIAKENVELYDEYGFNYKGVQTFVRDVEYDHRKSGVDTNATLNDVEDYIKTNNLTDEFNTWLEGKEKEYGIKEVIFDGFTPSGNRRYVPNTLENVSKIMKKQGRNGATGAAVSFQNFAARLMPSYGTLKDIRSKKGLLTSDREKFDKFRDKWSNVFFELGNKCQPDSTSAFDSYGMERLSEAAMTSDPQAYLKKEYNVDFSDEDTKRLKEMVKAIKEEHPAMYFETKFERPVRFDEFSAAVVPTTASNEVKQALQNAGVQIYEYDKEKEGDRNRAFNEAINSSDNIRFSLKSMMEKPEGWKQANKKAIHIAEAIERDPKFSLKNLDGTLIKAGTYFSGGGLVEEGLKGIIDPVVAVEYDEKISGVYRNNFGQHIVTADVRDVDPKELVKQIDGEVEYFHASPVCKNYSQAKSNHAEVELDKETAASTAEFINAIKPKVVNIENVKGYKDSEAMKTITDALDANGYTWDADVYNAADYGGYTNRERLIVRAVRDGKLPEKPKKMAHKSGWYEAVADIIPTLTEKKNGVAPWMDIRLKADGIDWRNIDKPLYVMGSAYADGKVPHAFADELLPTLRTKSGDVIVMPDGKVYRAMGRVLARVSGVSDDYKMPFSENLSHTIIGNGIPTQLTEYVIAPLLQNTLRPTTPEDGNTKFSLRYDKFEHDLNQWKKDNNLSKDAQRPTIPQRNAGESAVDFLRRVDEYRKQMALWKTAPTYEQHLLSDDTALGEFNRELQRGSVLKRIAFQDSMLAIRKAQEAIMKEVGVDRLNMAEDAYTAENRSHGKGKNEFEEYNNEFLQPLRKAYHQMKKVLGDSYDNVRIYMMAKHGLERDAQMAFKKSLDADYEDVAQRSAAYKAYKGDMNRIINDSDLEFGRVDFTTWRQRDNALRTKYSPSYMDYRYDENGIVSDYSGLSQLLGGSDFEEAAYKLVKDIESKYVTETHDLWDATNAATKKILRDGYKAGMMSKDTYQYVRDMYSHYIPLRGWDGTTADQVWDYIGGGKGAFNQTLKKAHGRTSIADDPIAYIENMAESGILLNNKNWVKKHLMLLAQNHPTSLLTLSKAWYVKSTDANGNEEWIPATPQITSQMDSNQVKAAIDAFEKKMEQMAQTGDATQKRDGLNIAYPQTHSEEREHEVRVMKDGEEYVIYVNGDPQLAQAMNNTRAHRVSEGIKNSISKRVIAVVGRKMAAAYTSLSPLFIPSNYFRDLTMTLASTAIREDAKYNYLLRKNLTTSWNLGFMLRDFQNGKLRDKVNNGNATPKEQMFYDFMMNGGETGFVSSLDVEDLKKKFKNDLKDLDRWKANPVKIGHTIMDCIEFLNRMIEDSNRFAIYMTSIQYGRSIDEAVNDAKDVTLNFNRKGTGEHSWQTIRNLYLFINPAVQSLQTLGALAKHHPFKFTAVTASWLASGVLVPIVNVALMQLGAAFCGGDGDDKDWYKDISKKYWQFTKWDRRNNFIMWVPTTHEFVKIPLAQEFRAFYGLGDMIASKMMGGELAEESWEDYGWDLVGQVVDMLPLDPTGYDGNIAVSLMPNAIRPVFELAFNVDFTGKPLFKDTEYNKYDPNFTKAYVGTPDWLVRASRMMNSIGNDYPNVQQNKWDALGDPRYNLNNPAVVDHVLSSYLGGAYTMGSQVLGLLTKSLNDPKEIKVADIPLFSKFVSNPDDRPVTKKQGDEFWDMKENRDRAANTLSKLKKQAKVDGDYSMLELFYGSEEYKQYKQDDVKVKKYEEDKKKERAEESGEEYRPHKLNAEDIYKAHATPKDDFEDLKLKQLYTKLNGFKTSYDLLVDTAPSHSEGYYKTNKAAIDAIDEISLDKQEISELKKGFLDDGNDAYNAEDMKQIRDLRKKILSVLEKANKVVVANQKAKAKK